MIVADRLVRPEALRGDRVGRDAVDDQVVAHRVRTARRQVVVDRVVALVIGVATDEEVVLGLREVAARVADHAEHVVHVGESIVLLEDLAEHLLGLLEFALLIVLAAEEQHVRKAGRPEEGWDELIESIDALRPLASEALLALFKLRMASQLEDAFGKVIEQQARRG